MRYAPGTIIPMPPIVGQNVALLPDGTVDPDHMTDCGESCVSSVLLAHSEYSISPGCIRQAMNPTGPDGLTTGAMLTRFLNGVGVRATRDVVFHAELWDRIAMLRHYGKYAIMLGNWLDPVLLHWVLAYERSSVGVWVMEPWSATRRMYSHQFINVSSAGEVVTCDLWHSW